MKMLGMHFRRASGDIHKFSGLFNNEMRQTDSGSSEADILTAAMLLFLNETHRAFKHVSVWKKVQHINVELNPP